MRRAALLVAAVAAVLLLSAARADEAKPLSDAWYVTRLQGRPAGYAHEQRFHAPLDGRPAIRTRSEIHLALRKEGAASRSETVTETWMTEDGELIRSTKVEREGPQEKRTTIERKGDAYRVVVETGETRTEKTVPVPPGTKVHPGLEGFLLVRLGLEVGRTHEVTAFCRTTLALTTDTARIEGRRRVEALGRPVEAFVVRMRSTSVPDVEVEVLYEEDGTEVALSMFGVFEVFLATEAEARAALDGGGTEIEPYLALRGAVIAWRSLEAATVEAEVAGEGPDDPPFFATNEYHEAVRTAPGRYTLRLRARPAPAAAAPAPPPADIETYLRATHHIQSDHEEIRAAAARVLAGEKEPLAIARKLCRHVFATIGKEPASVGAASALDTLRTAKGDCTEHAALLCALGRAAGLPTRLVSGIALRADSAGYHAWNEVWIGGMWVPVDATIDAVGLPAAAIAFGHSAGEPGDDLATGLAGLRILGKLRLAIASATRRGVTFDPRDPKQAVRVEGDVLDDRLCDLRLDLSGGLQYDGEHDATITIAVPGKGALSITCLGLEPRDDAERDAFVRQFLAAASARNIESAEGVLSGRPALERRFSFTTSGGVELAGQSRIVVGGGLTYVATAMKPVASVDVDLAAWFDRIALGDDRPAKEPSAPGPEEGR